MSTKPPSSPEDIDALLDEIQMKLFEMVGQVGEYRELLQGAGARPSRDTTAMLRALPGAKYHVASTYVDAQWKIVATGLKGIYPEASQPE